MITIASATAANVLKNLFEDGPALQSINGLAVTPGPNSVTFTLDTRFPAFSLVEIFKYTNSDYAKDMTSSNLVTSNELQLVGAARKKKHNYRVPEPANWVPDSFPGFSDPLLTPLEQDTHYWFRVTADSADASISPAVTIGRLWTSKRDVSVTMPELIVYQYGSSDIGNDVEDAVNSVASLFGGSPPVTGYSLDLNLGLYDQVNGLVDQTEKYFQSANSNDDLELPFPNVALECPGAHDFLWMSSHGQGNAGAWNVGPFKGVYDMPSTPLIPPQHGDYSGPWADATTITPRLADTPAELQSPIKIILDSGNWGTYYQLVAWVNVTLTPARHAPVIYATPGPKVIANLGHIAFDDLKAQKMKKIKTHGEGALALGTPEKLHLFVPGVKHTLWTQTRNITPKGQKTDISWDKLAEDISAPLAVFTDADGHMDVVGRGRNGNAWHAKWDGTAGSAAKTKWHDLGLTINEEIAMVHEGKALDIFMLNDAQEVMHARLTGETKPNWKSLGGKISTELTALSMPNGEIFLFGLGPKGDVWHNALSSNGKSNWSSLGSSDNVQLSVLSDDKHNIVLFAATKDRLVGRKAWNGKIWEPAAEKWTELGNLDSLFGSP